MFIYELINQALMKTIINKSIYIIYITSHNMNLFFLFNMFLINEVTEQSQNTDRFDKQMNQLNQLETEWLNNKTNENEFLHCLPTKFKKYFDNAILIFLQN